MKNILTAPFVREMCKTTANMYRLGWDERNGGNISWMLDEKEVAEYLRLNKVIRTIPLMGVNAEEFDVAPLIGKIFIVTRERVNTLRTWRATLKRIWELCALPKTAWNSCGDIRTEEERRANCPPTSCATWQDSNKIPKTGSSCTVTLQTFWQ